MTKFRIKVFKANENYNLCQDYLRGHQQVLKDYGIENISTNTETWFTIPNVYGLLVYYEDTDEVVGGVRVQIADGKIPLPVESAIGNLDPLIFKIIKDNLDSGTGEICGLWNAKKIAGMGISIILLRAGISIVSQIKLDSLFTICADYTLGMVRKVGFVQEDSLGNQGTFEYPNSSYIARVLRKLNSVTLDTAEEYDRNKIFFLRENPVCKLIETGPKGDFEVEYNLLIK